MTIAIVLLAAGQGTRMKSQKQKILHEVGGKPMVQHIFEAAEAVADIRPLLVVAPGETGLHTLFGHRAQYALQAEQMGTGHATMMAEAALRGQSDQVLVTYGDMPLLRAATMTRLAQMQRETGAAIAMLTLMGAADSSFGRVLRTEDGRVTEIVEVAEARRRPNSAQLLAVRELNVGVYCFAATWLWHNLPHLPLRQARSGPEYYLTDMVELARQQGELVVATVLEDADEGLGAGTRAELVAVEKAFRHRANRYWLEQGVTLVDPDSTYIDPDVIIGQDTVVWPNSYVQGQTVIGQGCVIGPNAIVRQARIGDGCRLEQVVVEGVTVAAGTAVPPLTHLFAPGAGEPQ